MTASRWILRLLIAVVALSTTATAVQALVTQEGSMTIHAQFDSGAGLYEGNEVAVLGMRIGKVTDINPRGSYVEVTMEVDKNVMLPSTVQAVTVSTSVLTARHVELTPPYQDGPVLEDGAELGLDRTRTPIEFDRLLNMADKMSRQLQGDGAGDGPVGDLLQVAAEATDGQGANMRAALGQMSAAMALSADNGAQTKDSITAIIDNLSELTDVAAKNDQDLREFGGSVEEISAILDSLDLGSGDTGAKINDILTQSANLLEANRESLNSTAANANVVVGSLAEYRSQLAEFLDLTPLLMNNAYNSMDLVNRGARVHAQLEKVAFDGQLAKEVCNLLGMRQLGCSTGTLKDYGPDYGVSAMLEGIAGLPQ